MFPEMHQNNNNNNKHIIHDLYGSKNIFFYLLRRYIERESQSNFIQYNNKDKLFFSVVIKSLTWLSGHLAVFINSIFASSIRSTSQESTTCKMECYLLLLYLYRICAEQVCIIAHFARSDSLMNSHVATNHIYLNYQSYDFNTFYRTFNNFLSIINSCFKICTLYIRRI